MDVSYEQIASFLESRKGFLSRLARQYNLEFDDFYQDVVLFCFDTVAKLQATHRPIQDLYSYLLKCIRNYAVDSSINRYRLHLVSLDTPLSEETGATLLDILPAPAGTKRVDPVAKRRQQALYAALRRLPREEQQYLKRVHKLAGFYPVSQPGRAFNRHRSDSSLSHQAYKYLRKDAALAAAALAGGAR